MITMDKILTDITLLISSSSEITRQMTLMIYLSCCDFE